MPEEFKEKEEVDAGDVIKETTQALDVAQRLLTLETQFLLLEARIVLLEKQSVDASQAIVAKQPNITIYGSNRKLKDSRIK
jgi:hypothetical protein